MAFSFSDELKIGFSETFKYALSHHEPTEYYKCFHLKIKGNDIYICSRCLGVYIGILSGLILGLSLFLDPLISLIIMAIFPLLALLDWALSTFTSYKSHNFVRFISGVLLGTAYSSGLLLVLKNRMILSVILIELCYIIIAFIMIRFKFSNQLHGKIRPS